MKTNNDPADKQTLKKMFANLHPFLFTLDAVLFFYMRAKIEAFPTEIFRPLLFLGTLLILLYPLVRKIAGKGDWAAILLTIFVFGFYFDRDYFAIVGIATGAILLVVICSFVLTRQPIQILSISLALTVIGFFLLTVQSIILFRWLKAIPPSYYEAMATRSSSALVPVSEPASGIKPDIYYIVLDSYSGSDILQESYGYDNSAFLDDLRDLGFIVPKSVLSNYPRTALSISSTLDMQYWDSISPNMEHVPFWWPTKPVLDHSRVQASLESIGYQSVSIASDWQLSNNTTADYYYKPYPVILTEYENLIIRSTALTLLQRPFQSIAPVRTNESHRRFVLYSMDALKSIPEISGPKFVFVHILPPHAPFVFHADGSPLDSPQAFWFGYPLGLTKEEYRQNYLAQLEFVNTQILSVVKTVLEKSITPPIIIIQADHGLGLFVSFDEPENDCIKERFSVLGAYYLPGKSSEAIPENFTSVNAFRVVLNEYFGAHLDLLENHQFFTKGHNLFAGLHEVTEQIQNVCTAPGVDPQ